MNVHNVKPDGAMTFWKCGITNREGLNAELLQLQLEKFMPAVRSDADCLKAAMREYCELETAETRKDKGKETPVDKLVQGLKKPKKNGFQVLNVERGEDDNDYCKSFGCKVDEHGVVTITRGYAHVRSIQEAFSAHKKLVTGSAVSSMLATIAMEHLDGTMLKSGLYWIPEDVRDKWSTIAKAVAAAAVDGDTDVTELRYLMDDNGVEAIKDAIIDEVFAAAEALQAEITSGELGTQALTRRQFAAAALHARVTRYEVIIGEALTALHETVRVAEEAAASAIAVKEASEVYSGVF